MDIDLKPFNITLLPSDRNVLRNLMPVTSVDIYDGSSSKMNDTGLFSTVIFGRPTETRRQTTFSYIDLRTKIIHPILYKNIERVASLYAGIYCGTAYGIWNDKAKVFEKSDAVDGDTGVSFFMKHFNDIKFEKNESEIRNLRIDVLDKYRESAIYDFVLVLPAGLRDVEEDVRGQLKQDEVNEYYRNLISLSKNIDGTFRDNKFNDGTKLLMQRNFNAIYELIYGYLNGKRGLTQEKFCKRRIENGTRTVMASLNLAVEEIGGPQEITITDAVIGLYQTLKGCLPLIQNAFKNPLIMDTFLGDSTALVIDKKTHKLDRHPVSAKIRDWFMTEDGVNTLINQFEFPEIRDKPVEIAGGYLAMVYQDDVSFRVIRDVNSVPESRLEKLHPITWGELFYYLAKPLVYNKPLWITRYPITNVDSMIPGFPYVKTTVTGKPLKELDSNWEPIDNNLYNEWPIVGLAWVDTISPHPSKMKNQGADSDGDTASGDFTYSDESIKEVNNYFDNLDNWFINSGKVRYLGSTDTVEWYLKSSTYPEWEKSPEDK